MPEKQRTDACYAWAPGETSWSELPKMGTRREGAAAVALPDGRVLVRRRPQAPPG